MKLIKILNYGVVAGVIVSALSFFLPIVPCSRAPVVANPEYSLAMCKLPNPFGETIVGISQKFYTFSTDPLVALIFTFLIVLIAVFLFFTLVKKKQGKVVDLTHKNK